jgi:hypothetical protein
MSRPLFLFPLLLLALALGGCEGKKTAAQLNLEKQKAWQAQKKERAARTYQELIEKFPDSEHVAEAKQRLAAIGPVATPKGSTPRPAGTSPKASPAKK